MRRFLLTLGAGLTVSCSSGPPGTLIDIPIAVEGVVQSGDQPVAGATVLLRLTDVSPPAELERTTDSDGRFRFDAFVSRSPIPISLEARKSGFSAIRISDTWSATDQAKEGIMWPAKKRYVLRLSPQS